MRFTEPVTTARVIVETGRFAKVLCACLLAKRGTVPSNERVTVRAYTGGNMVSWEAPCRSEGPKRNTSKGRRARRKKEKMA